MIEKIKKWIANFLLAIKNFLPSKNNEVPPPSEQNSNQTVFVESSINYFRNKNFLYKYGFSTKLKSIAEKHAAEMAKQNRLIYTLNGLSLGFGLLKEGVKTKNHYMMITHNTPDSEGIVRKILSNNVYRNLILSDSFCYIGVSVYNGYCAIILTSKF